MVQDRRTFLSSMGAALLAASCRNHATLLAASPAPRRPPGLQLYTVRRQAAADLDGTLRQVAAIGYRDVELAGYYNRTASEFRELLRRHGLSAPSGHIAIDLIETSPAKTFADARTVGHEWITVPSLPRGRRETIDDWKRVGAQFNAAAARARAEGFRFAFHNHNDVMKPVGGRLPIDILMAETDPALVSYQMDLYWAVSGGADPLSLLARYPGRFRMFHLKDGVAPYTDATQTDLGRGTVPLARIVAAATGIERSFIESDSARDPLAFAADGYKYITNIKL